jgi:RNA polymerase sigma-70 factor (ECF subfamily)
MKTKLIVGLSVLAIHMAAGPARADEISLATAAPVVVRTIPVAGSTGVDPLLTEIRVTYSKVMQDGSWSWSTWGEENFPKTTGKPYYLDSKRTCVLPVKLEPDKFYATWLNSENFGNFTDTDGRSAVPYLLTFRTGKTVGDIRGELDAKIAQLAKAGTTVEEAISVLGEPREYVWENQTLKKENLPSIYIMVYSKGVNVVVHDGVVTELRSHPPGPGFTYRGKLRLGSSLEEMLEVVGPPSETVTGQPLAFEASVLYRDINGEKGRAYYARPDKQIRCFFMRNKISALYMPLGEPSGTGVGSATRESSGTKR